MNKGKKLTILQMNDTHAYFNLHPEMFFENGSVSYRNAGGYSRIATIFKQAHEQNPGNVLTFDNGDTIHGTYPAIKSKGEALVPIVNALGFDAMTAHWEFAYGPKQFERIVSMLDYPMLACNCYVEGTKELVFPSHTIIEKSDLKIGVIGVAAHIVDKTMPPHFSEGISFTLGNEELPGLIKKLRTQEKVDMILVLSHVGLPQEVKIAEEVDGIDILLSAHTHNRMVDPVVVNDTIIMQSGCHGSFIGKLDLEIADHKIQQYHHKLIVVAEDITPDPEVQQLVNNSIAPYQMGLEIEIGHTKTALNRYAQLETTMDNLLLQSLLDVSGADLAFSNGWRYGAPIPPGPITMNDIWNIIPTNPPISLVSITGAELLDMLEDNLENTFSCDPYEQMGGYVKRCLGLKMFIKIENTTGMRIQELFIGDEPVDKNRTYQASFITVQGVPKKYGKDRYNLAIHAIDALEQYIQKNSPISAELQGTVQVI